MSRSPINEGRNSPNRQRATPVELTPVHQRASRRLRGDSPEFAPLSFTPRETRTTDAATMTSQVIRDPEPEPQLARHVPTYSDVLRQPAVQSSAPVATTVTYPPTARSTPRVFQPTVAYRPPAPGNAAVSLTVPASSPPRRGGVDTCRWRREAFDLTLFLTTSRPSMQRASPFLVATISTTDKAATIGASTDHDADSALNAEWTKDPQLADDMDAAWSAKRDAYLTPLLSKQHRSPKLPLNTLSPSPDPTGQSACLLFHSEVKKSSYVRSEVSDLVTGPGQPWEPRFGSLPETRHEQSLAVMSTPSSHIADSLLKVQELSLGQRTFPKADTCHASSGFLDQSYAATHNAPANRSARRASNLDTEPITVPLRTSPFMSSVASTIPPLTSMLSAVQILWWGPCYQAIADEQRQMTACANASAASPVEPASSGPALKKGGRSCSKTRSRYHSKARTKSNQPCQCPSEEPDCSGITDVPTAVEEGTIKKCTATSAATRDHQQPLASQTTNAKTAPRELFPFQPTTHTAPCSPPPPNTNTDPFPEIARLRRKMEERHAQMHIRIWTLQ
ncbi:hypothetical protein HPB50_018833 [Hyalomma asiaticum]|uniref:Uncharacterized protein n=1 Tax=Hyalomma asiaticum TaxID=266040 RepID=A0ACB7RVD1_HYAAI|nr:hypothetical protein HPB50_018833 [Hyalomma asiaticum]